jgi:hypothetical protein
LNQEIQYVCTQVRYFPNNPLIELYRLDFGKYASELPWQQRNLALSKNHSRSNEMEKVIAQK